MKFSEFDPMQMLIKTFATPEKLKGFIEKAFTPDTLKIMAAGISKKLGSYTMEPGELPMPVYTLRVVNGEMKFSIITFKEIDYAGEKILVKNRTLENLSFQQFANQFFPGNNSEKNKE